MEPTDTRTITEIEGIADEPFDKQGVEIQISIGLQGFRPSDQARAAIKESGIRAQERLTGEVKRILAADDICQMFIAPDNIKDEVFSALGFSLERERKNGDR